MSHPSANSAFHLAERRDIDVESRLLARFRSLAEES